jgi:hypothetical protein
VSRGAFAFILPMLLSLGSPWETLSGQEGSFAFLLRGGADVPLGSFRSHEAGWQGKSGGGASLGMGFAFPVYGPLGGYLGFGQRRFACDEEVCPPDKDWTSTGFDVALRVVFGEEGLRLWTQGGLHTHRMEGRIRVSERGHRITSEGGGGFEAGAGLLVRVGRRTSLAPGIRYGQGHVPFPGRASMQLRYVVLDVGLVMGF